MVRIVHDAANAPQPFADGRYAHHGRPDHGLLLRAGDRVPLAVLRASREAVHDELLRVPAVHLFAPQIRGVFERYPAVDDVDPHRLIGSAGDHEGVVAGALHAACYAAPHARPGVPLLVGEGANAGDLHARSCGGNKRARKGVRCDHDEILRVERPHRHVFDVVPKQGAGQTMAAQPFRIAVGVDDRDFAGGQINVRDFSHKSLGSHGLYSFPAVTSVSTAWSYTPATLPTGRKPASSSASQGGCMPASSTGKSARA